MNKVMILHREGFGEGTLLHMQKRFNEAGMDFTICTNKKFDMDGDWDGYSHYIRWGCTGNLPRDSRGKLPVVVNQAKNIHRSADKAGFRELLGDLAPKLYIDWDEIEYPVIVRPVQHAFSNDLHVCHGVGEFIALMVDKNWGPEDCYVSEWVKKDHEFRVMVANNRVVYVDEKLPQDKNDATWDRPGKECIFKNVGWSAWRMGVIEAGLKAASIAGLDFCVVDIITKDDDTYVLEVNTAPMLNYFQNKESYNQRVLSEALIHLINHGPLEPVNEVKSWKDAIHPTRWNKENMG